MGFLKFFFGAKKRQVRHFLKSDAAILDVRTQAEWDKGHIEGSIHIPLNELKDRVKEVKDLNKPIVACCESGIRSGKAAKYLNTQNIEATNGGGWISLSELL